MRHSVSYPGLNEFIIRLLNICVHDSLLRTQLHNVIPEPLIIIRRTIPEKLTSRVVNRELIIKQQSVAKPV
jgi:hypothetical protein